MSQLIRTERITPENFHESPLSMETIVEFLHMNLDSFRDPRDQIRKCLDYALGVTPGRRGFVLAAWQGGDDPDAGQKPDRDKLLGIGVVCETGMSGFVPENLLVYIAVDPSTRGKGIGKKMVLDILEEAEGDVALHVEADNPARRLYERIGFTNKYLELRFKK